MMHDDDAAEFSDGGYVLGSTIGRLCLWSGDKDKGDLDNVHSYRGC